MRNRLLPFFDDTSRIQVILALGCVTCFFISFMLAMSLLLAGGSPTSECHVAGSFEGDMTAVAGINLSK